MIEKLATLWPEMAMLVGACICMLLGLSSNSGTRRASVWIAAATLGVAGLLVVDSSDASLANAALAVYVKLAVVVVGLLLLMVAAGVPDRLKQTIEAEAAAGRGLRFDPAEVMRGEFYAFFLFSLMGVMLCASATDLVWLFLALELTSLPTYIMIVISRDHVQAQESGVKYFFLGAMAAAIFLYGFAFIYGATGFTDFPSIAAYIQENGVNSLMLLGLVLAIVGIGFKIAAAPMHFYVADVYQGANVSVTAFLAFVPKTAGFIGIILLLQLVPGELMPPALQSLLWVMAALTMTIGNVLGLLQQNVKRVLAYSSIAHSGYMLVPLVAGVAAADGMLSAAGAAVLFYLIAYGLATLAAFAVLGCLERNGEEVQTYDDISGLAKRHPLPAGIMLLSVLSLIGLPPMIGFLGKMYLFGTAINATGGDSSIIVLVVIAVLNSAISAVYYLRIAAACFFGNSIANTVMIDAPARRLGAGIAATAALVLGLAGNQLVTAAREAAPGTFSPGINAPGISAPKTNPSVQHSVIDDASAHADGMVKQQP